VVATFQRDLRANWEAWGKTSSHATPDARASAVASFEQVFPFCTPTAPEIVGRNLDPAAVATLMLAKAEQAMPGAYDGGNPDNALARTFLQRLTLNAYRHLLGQRAFINEIVPTLWREELERLGRLESKVDAVPDATVAKLLEVLDRRGEETAAETAGVHRTAIIQLAKRISENVEDLDQAFRELERAVEIAIEVQQEGSRHSNLGAFVDAVLERLANLTAEGRFDEAAAEAHRAYDQWERDEAERREQALAQGLRLIDAGLRQELLCGDAAAAARQAVRRVDLETHDPPARFDSLRQTRREWRERGRDQGLLLDQAVSVELARIEVLRASNSDQRGAALNDLGVSLQELGARETGTGRMERAVDAYRAALEEFTRDRVPYQWTYTQENLGILYLTMFRKTGERTYLETARAHATAALDVYREMSASYDIGTAENLIRSIEAEMQDD